MANSESDSNNQKDDQTETSEELDETSEQEESAETSDAEQASPDETVEEPSDESSDDNVEASDDEPSDEDVDEDVSEDEKVETSEEADVATPSDASDLSDASDASDSVLFTDRDVSEATGHENSRPGVAVFFDHPDALMDAARRTRDSDYEQFDCFAPFPVHGLDEAMGLGRSWIPWVTFAAGLTGFLCAVALEFGTMTFDWPLIIGGKPFAPWPAFVPVMFELTVLIGGVTTGVVMLKAAGCFSPAEVIDPDLTNDRFALWISADDDHYEHDQVVEFARAMNPTEVRTFSEKADSDE